MSDEKAKLIYNDGKKEKEKCGKSSQAKWDEIASEKVLQFFISIFTRCFRNFSYKSKKFRSILWKR